MMMASRLLSIIWQSSSCWFLPQRYASEVNCSSEQLKCFQLIILHSLDTVLLILRGDRSRGDSLDIRKRALDFGQELK